MRGMEKNDLEASVQLSMYELQDLSLQLIAGEVSEGQIISTIEALSDTLRLLVDCTKKKGEA